MSITVVMPILGRPLFTLRSLWYLNSIDLPWRVIVADGGNDRSICRMLNEPSTFPNLDLTHYRRPDVDVRAFYQKCLDAVRMAQTRYVLMFDNDDFITIDALKRLSAHLDGRPDHAAVGGIVASLHVMTKGARARIPFIQGPIDAWAVRYAPKFLSQTTAVERIAAHFDRYFPTYYSLHRKEALVDAFEFIVESGISDLPLHEIFLSLHTLLSGKITTLCSTVGYWRQVNIPSHSHGSVLRWPQRVLQEAWQSDFHSAADRFAAKLHAAEPTTSEPTARDLLVDGFGRFLRRVSSGTAAHESPLAPLEDMLIELRSYGATQQDCEQLQEDLRPIAACLEGPEFRRFVVERAPRLLASWTLRRTPYRIIDAMSRSPAATRFSLRA